MLRCFLFAQVFILMAPSVDACEVSWGRTFQNLTVYSANHRFAAILRLYEKVPDFARRRTSLILNDPIPNWHNVPVVIYDGRAKIGEFHVDIELVTDLLISDSGQYVVGVLRTKNYPCAGPPTSPDDQIATIYRRDGAFVSVVKLRQIVPDGITTDSLEPWLEYSIHTERDGGEVLVITYGDIMRRVQLTNGAIIEERP